MHDIGRIVLTNISGRTCTVRGFGGLSYLGHGDGAQVGAAATRDRGTAVRTVVLAPRGRARSAITQTRAEACDDSTCVPVHVDGFRLYVPDSRVLQFVPRSTTGCAGSGISQLGHQAYRRP